MNALLSVSDKTGIVEFAKELHALGIKLLSTGGTAKLLADKGLPVTEVAEVTQFPEMLDGRVKTLHPKVHGGLLARRELPEHMAALKEHGIDTIDLLVVNLYPFEATVAKAGCTLADAIENHERGGTGAESGAYFGIWNLVTKLNLALAAGIALPLLAALGYEPGARDADALASLSFVYALVPVVLKVLAALFLWYGLLRRRG